MLFRSPFSSHLQSFPASGSFQMSQLFASGGQNIGLSALTSVLPNPGLISFRMDWLDFLAVQGTLISHHLGFHSFNLASLVFLSEAVGKWAEHRWLPAPVPREALVSLAVGGRVGTEGSWVSITLPPEGYVLKGPHSTPRSDKIFLLMKAASQLSPLSSR